MNHYVFCQHCNVMTAVNYPCHNCGKAPANIPQSYTQSGTGQSASDNPVKQTHTGNQTASSSSQCQKTDYFDVLKYVAGTYLVVHLTLGLFLDITGLLQEKWEWYLLTGIFTLPFIAVTRPKLVKHYVLPWSFHVISSLYYIGHPRHEDMMLLSYAISFGLTILQGFFLFLLSCIKEHRDRQLSENRSI